jgi:hypothetical protein
MMSAIRTQFAGHINIPHKGFVQAKYPTCGISPDARFVAWLKRDWRNNWPRSSEKGVETSLFSSSRAKQASLIRHCIDLNWVNRTSRSIRWNNSATGSSAPLTNCLRSDPGKISRPWDFLFDLVACWAEIEREQWALPKNPTANVNLMRR